MRGANLVVLGGLGGAMLVGAAGLLMGQGSAQPGGGRIVGVTGFDEGSSHVAVAWEVQNGQLVEVARGTVPKAKQATPEANRSARALVRANIARFAALDTDQRTILDALHESELSKTQDEQDKAYQRAIDVFFGRANCPECDAEYTRSVADAGSPTQCFAAYVKCILTNCH